MKWAVLFPDNWLSYSPSCINFVKMLEKYNQEYLVIHLDDNTYNNSTLNINHYPINIRNTILLKILKRLKMYKHYKILLLVFYTLVLKVKYKFNKFVGFDDIGFLAAYIMNKKAIYYSLEIIRSKINKFIFSKLYVDLLIIQSEERKNHLCKGKNINTIYLQNSLIKNKEYNTIQYNTIQYNLVYFGSIIYEHGIEYCINALYSLPNVKLTLKGTYKNDYYFYLLDKYADIVNSGKLFFDFDYLEQEKIIRYLQQYDIGFCFYNHEYTIKDNFNYISSPSGKMFSYFAAEIPVIGSDFIGLSPIKIFNAGILLKQPVTEKIKNAVNTIYDNYEYYKKNAIKASIEYDYENMFNKNKDIIFGTENIDENRNSNKPSIARFRRGIYPRKYDNI